MTREMAEQMKGEQPARELAATCLAEFDKWADNARREAASLFRNDPAKAAEHALQCVRADMDDYLEHSLATHLTALRLQGAFDPEEHPDG